LGPRDTPSGLWPRRATGSRSSHDRNRTSGQKDCVKTPGS
jgi:hypothetical protein